METPKKPHVHVWKYYDGALGYESMVCSVCGIDIADYDTGPELLEALEAVLAHPTTADEDSDEATRCLIAKAKAVLAILNAREKNRISNFTNKSSEEMSR